MEKSEETKINEDYANFLNSKLTYELSAEDMIILMENGAITKNVAILNKVLMECMYKINNSYPGILRGNAAEYNHMRKLTLCIIEKVIKLGATCIYDVLSYSRYYPNHVQNKIYMLCVKSPNYCKYKIMRKACENSNIYIIQKIINSFTSTELKEIIITYKISNIAIIKTFIDTINSKKSK